MKNNKWKRNSSFLLAVCLIFSLMFLGNVPGVFALQGSDSAEHIEVEKNTGTTEAVENSESNSDVIEGSEKDKNAEANETFVESSEKSSSDETSSGSEVSAEDVNSDDSATENEEQIAVQADTSDISALIDADIALLKWKAVGGTITFTLDSTEYKVTDETSYREAYNAVYKALLSKSESIAADLSAQTISKDTVWNVSGNISMNGNITVSAGNRLVVLGTGAITKTGNYGMIVNGTACLQGQVYLNGNSKEVALVQIPSQSGTVYLADDFRIGNNNGNGVNAKDGTIYMVGGLVGTTDISFDWYNENNTSIGAKNYKETLSYIKSNLSSEEYNYINRIAETEGNIKGIQLQGTSRLYLADGTIAGNGNPTVTDGTGITVTDNSQFVMTGGVVVGNQTGGSGGGLNINGKSNVEISAGLIAGNHSATYAGGINMSGTLKLKDNAVVAFNSCAYNGGAVLIAQNATCTMEGQAAVVHNRAIGSKMSGDPSKNNSGKGGAFRVVGTLIINSGKINYNSGNGPLDSTTVQQDIGGAISAQTDILDKGKPTQAIRVATVTLNGGEIAYNKAKGQGGAIWMVCAAEGYTATFALNGTNIHDNQSASNGGAIYLSARAGTLNADITSGRLANNTSGDNGGGIYLELTSVGETLTVNIGKESQENSSLDISGNTAASQGGGLYIARVANQNGTSNINLYSGSLSTNYAQQGGAIGIVKGNLNIYDGEFTNNTADSNGGGAYVADGTVRMFGGKITGNTAKTDGGGLYISSDTAAADVVVRSGSIVNNIASGNGGGIAVVSTSGSSNDKVTLGVLKTHPNLSTGGEPRTFEAFPYTDSTDNQSHTHSSCPALENNTATGNGGGIYMGSSAAELDIYCLTEKDNISKNNSNGNAVMTAGGKLSIGDSENSDENARGNILINSAMLVEGGVVDIYGNMQNPLFKNNVLVDIKKNTDSFADHRGQVSNDDVKKINYKVHYFENFTNVGTQTASGLYTAIQYTATEEITAKGTIFEHTGWKIVGWANKSDKEFNKVTYKIGDQIGNADKHEAWKNNANEALILYAIWERVGYTVVYNANADTEGYTGSMESQSFEYGVSKELTLNTFKVNGMRFTGWNTQRNGSGNAYVDRYSDSMISNKDNDIVTLYAQWVKCTHLNGDHPGKVTYTVDGQTITEKCDCGYAASVSISAANVYYDEKEHPAILTYSNTALLEKTPTVVYKYKSTETGEYGDMSDGESVPKRAGYYQASVTLGDKTVTVVYQIKSPTAGTLIEAQVAAGQIFNDFQGNDSVSISQDDAFTVQFTVNGLKTDVYQDAPVLSFDTSLPVDTSIIMQTDDSYWYTKVGSGNNSSTTEISLTEFVKMGGSAKFTYDNPKTTQSYRFIVDFSKAAMNVSTNKISLSYTPTGAAGTLTASGSVTTTAKTEFGLTYSDNVLNISAPKQLETNRWHDKALMLVLSADKTKLPADAKLTVVSGDKTNVYALNSEGEFVIPYSWAENQSLSLSLNSGIAALHGQSYAFNASLFVSPGNTGVADNKVKAGEYDTNKKVDSVSLQIPVLENPSLKITKITGTQKLVSVKDTLNLEISTANIDNSCNIQATIQKKDVKSDSYSGTYLNTPVSDGKNIFSLGAISEEGSYRLLITVTKDNKNLLTVPYYFIVK